ncbi:hypothetical protein J437_LFUL017175 [Ladona fulva]|uniref:Voltage-dependent anion-selective channel protein 3 n=1 Tax=Ladona fulva TaxID=123851 RepID=A0A8K0KP56_LADFU|nr:hypothetical protein J437_LFUL017175 [Ladona fulva]
MAPPSFGDLGKTARDIFSKGYHFGLIMLDIKTKTQESIDISAGCSLSHDTGKAFGSLETKYTAKDYGLVFTEKWNTDNSLCTDISLENLFPEGLKLSFDATFSPPLGKKKARAKAQYKLDKMILNLDADLNPNGPLLNGSTVLSHKGFSIGWLSGFDCACSKFTNNNIAICLTNEDFEICSKVNHNLEYSASLYQKVSPKLETGVQLAWSADSNDTKFEIGSKYTFDENTIVRAKVDNSSHVGFSLQQIVHTGVSVTMSLQIDGKNFNQGTHKFGVALEMKA